MSYAHRPAATRPRRRCRRPASADLGRILLGLFLVVLVIGALYAAMKRAQRGRLPGSLGRRCRCARRHQLGPGRNLHLVEIGDRVLLVGATEHGIALLQGYDRDEAAPRDCWATRRRSRRAARRAAAGPRRRRGAHVHGRPPRAHDPLAGHDVPEVGAAPRRRCRRAGPRRGAGRGGRHRVRSSARSDSRCSPPSRRQPSSCRPAAEGAWSPRWRRTAAPRWRAGWPRCGGPSGRGGRGGWGRGRRAWRSLQSGRWT